MSPIEDLLDPDSRASLERDFWQIYANRVNTYVDGMGTRGFDITGFNRESMISEILVSDTVNYRQSLDEKMGPEDNYTDAIYLPFLHYVGIQEHEATEEAIRSDTIKLYARVLDVYNFLYKHA